MKGRISIIGLLNKSNNEELRMLYNLIKKHSYFQGERRELYKQVVRLKNTNINKTNK